MSKKNISDLKEIKGAFVAGKKKEEFLAKCYETVSKLFEKREVEEAEAQRKHRDFRVRTC